MVAERRWREEVGEGERRGRKVTQGRWWRGGGEGGKEGGRERELEGRSEVGGRNARRDNGEEEKERREVKRNGRK